MSLRRSSVLLALAACHPSGPRAPAAPVSDEQRYGHTWTIERHALGARALITESDAALWEGHTIAIAPTGAYQTPWQGNCTDAKVAATRARRASEVAASVEIPVRTVEEHVLLATVDEYRFTCDEQRTPGLTFYVADRNAMTCWSGVCYFLSRAD